MRRFLVLTALLTPAMSQITEMNGGSVGLFSCIACAATCASVFAACAFTAAVPGMIEVGRPNDRIPWRHQDHFDLLALVGVYCNGD